MGCIVSDLAICVESNGGFLRAFDVDGVALAANIMPGQNEAAADPCSGEAVGLTDTHGDFVGELLVGVEDFVNAGAVVEFGAVENSAI